MTRTRKLGRTTLLALGTGTSIACVCMLGVAMIRATAPGLWSVVVVAAAYAVCRCLAGVLAHLVKTVPSGAGMFAFVARAWGPVAGVAAIAPYAILMVVLGGLEALVAGHLLKRWLPMPASFTAVVLLASSYVVCVTGVRLSSRVQAVATWLLVAGIAIATGHLLVDSAGTVAWVDRLLVPPPSPAAFASAVGQAIFLFMGFELLCTQIESSDVPTVSWALRRTVLVLAILYGFVLLAVSGHAVSMSSGPGIAGLLPEFTGASGDAASLVMLVVCLLASMTSLNGAFMGVSRLIATMARQRVLPPALGIIHVPALVPRRALTVLLALCAVAAVAIDCFGSHRVVIHAASISAATLYALALLVRGRPPFALTNAPRAAGAAFMEKALAGVLLAIAAGVLVEAGDSIWAVSTLLAMTLGAGLLAALRLRRGSRRAFRIREAA
jgi:amino acid transporter